MAHIITTDQSVRNWFGGASTLDVEATSLRRLMTALDARFPGFREAMESRVAVAIDGEIYQNALDVPLTPNAEVCFIQRISGG
jgi:hypothetical protein